MIVILLLILGGMMMIIFVTMEGARGYSIVVCLPRNYWRSLAGSYNISPQPAGTVRITQRLPTNPR